MLVAITRQTVNKSKFNQAIQLPHNLRVSDVEMAMQDVYDFFFDVNTYLFEHGMQRLDDMLRPANLTGTLSDMITDALAKHSRTLTVNLYHNGHPDLIVRDRYPNNAVKAGHEGIEVKSTKKKGGAVDMHGARNQTLAIFVYSVDNDRSKPAQHRDPLTFREVYIATVTVDDFRKNERGELGTRTATLHADGIAKFRQSGLVYYDWPSTQSDQGSKGSWRS